MQRGLWSTPNLARSIAARPVLGQSVRLVSARALSLSPPLITLLSIVALPDLISRRALQQRLQLRNISLCCGSLDGKSARGQVGRQTCCSLRLSDLACPPQSEPSHANRLPRLASDFLCQTQRFDQFYACSTLGSNSPIARCLRLSPFTLRRAQAHPLCAFSIRQSTVHLSLTADLQTPRI